MTILLRDTSGMTTMDAGDDDRTLDGAFDGWMIIVDAGDGSVLVVKSRWGGGGGRRAAVWLGSVPFLLLM